MGLELQTYNVLALIATALLLVVTGSVIYLTLIDWQDRRRQSREMIDSRASRRRQK